MKRFKTTKGITSTLSVSGAAMGQPMLPVPFTMLISIPLTGKLRYERYVNLKVPEGEQKVDTSKQQLTYKRNTQNQ